MQENWKKVLAFLPEGFIVMDKATKDLKYANNELFKILSVHQNSDHELLIKETSKFYLKDQTNSEYQNDDTDLMNASNR